MTPRRPFPAPPVPALAIHGPDGISQIHLTLGPPECVLSAQPWDGREEMAGRRHLRSTRPGLGQRLGAWVMVRCREGGRSQRQLGVARVNGGLAEIVGPERYGGGHLEAVGLAVAKSGVGLHEVEEGGPVVPPATDTQRCSLRGPCSVPAPVLAHVQRGTQEPDYTKRAAKCCHRKVREQQGQLQPLARAFY